MSGLDIVGVAPPSALDILVVGETNNDNNNNNNDPTTTTSTEEFDPNQLSVSPRDRLSYVADRKEVRAIETFDDNGQLRLMQRLIMLLRLETIKQQPNDIIDFGCEFFSPHNREMLRGMLGEESMTTPFVTPFVNPLNIPSNRPYKNKSTNQQFSEPYGK